MSSKEGKNWKGSFVSLDQIPELSKVNNSEKVVVDETIEPVEEKMPKLKKLSRKQSKKTVEENVEEGIDKEVELESVIEEPNEADELEIKEEPKKTDSSQLRKLAKRKNATVISKKIKESDKVARVAENKKSRVKSETEKTQVKMPNPEDIEGKIFLSEEEEEVEFQVDLPDSSSIEGKNLDFEKGRLKSSAEFAMEETDAVAAEYNEKKLKAEDIESSKTIDELLSFVDKTEGLQGSQDYFDREQLRRVIEGVRSGELTIDYVTRSGGLRQKVFDLLQNENQVKIPLEETSLDKIRASLGIVPEVVQEEVLEEVKIPTPAKIKPPKVIVDSDRNKPEYLNEEELQLLAPEENNVYLKEEELQLLKEEKFGHLLEEEAPVPAEKVENKKAKRDENVLEIPKKDIEVETKEELPDLEALGLISKTPKNSKEKPKIFAEDESEPKEAVETFNRAEKLSQLEKTLSEKRKELVAVHKESEILNAEYEKKMKNPFHKFLANAFGVGIKEFNKKIEGFEAVRLDYQKMVDDIVEEKILKRMEHLMSLRTNNKERQQYEPKNFSDIEQYLNLKNLVGDDKDRIKKLVEQSRYGNVSLAEILKDKIFRGMEIDLAKRNYIFKILEKEVRDQIAVEENELIDSILKTSK